MIINILVNLYSVKLLWKVLGIEDYGIYNVVGGIVLMFTFLKNTMVATSQRYISYELGRGDKERTEKTFAMSLKVHILLALVIVILAETIGLWFLNAKLNIPEERMWAANWVYQCTIISFALTIISVPYNACIVAHEHMKIYGYLGIIEAFLKLGIVLLVFISPWDHLVSYGVLVLLMSVVLRLLYTIYCRRHFTECRATPVGDKDLLKDMFSFAGWSFLGSLGMSVRDQGLNIVINLFFNVTVNAAKAIASQVGSVINGFASNFTMAINPQITKRYANGETESMMALIFNGCKYSLILMSIVVVPLIFAADTALHLWLDNVAPYTVGFLQLTLIMSLIDCVVSPITTSLQATGKIKVFQILICCIMMANIPLACVWLLLDHNPYIVMFAAIITSATALITRLILLHNMIKFSFRKFFMKVYSRTLPYIIVFSILGYILIAMFQQSLIGIIGYGCTMLAIAAALIYVISLDRKEKRLLIGYIRNRIRI